MPDGERVLGEAQVGRREFGRVGPDHRQRTAVSAERELGARVRRRKREPDVRVARCPTRPYGASARLAAERSHRRRATAQDGSFAAPARCAGHISTPLTVARGADGAGRFHTAQRKPRAAYRRLVEASGSARRCAAWPDQAGSRPRRPAGLGSIRRRRRSGASARHRR